MKTKVFSFILLMLVSVANTPVYAFTAEEKSAISTDISTHFAERLNSAIKSAEEDGEEPVLKAKDQKVMMKALYSGIIGPLSLAGVQIDEKGFYQKVGKLLNAGAEFGALPAAITIGFFRRADLLVGKTEAVEMNFYLDDGKLRVSTYDIDTLNVGLAAHLKVGYYVALCFGGCTGGDPNGTYIGVDADIVFGVGANIYIEVGVDTTDYYKAKKIGEKFTMSDFYDAKAVYIGAGIDIGFGGGISMGFTDYRMTSDLEVLDLYSIMYKPDFSTEVKSAFDRKQILQHLH